MWLLAIMMEFDRSSPPDTNGLGAPLIISDSSAIAAQLAHRNIKSWHASLLPHLTFRSYLSTTLGDITSFTNLTSSILMYKHILPRIKSTPTTRAAAITPQLQRRSFISTSKMDYASLPTPEKCVADFCLVPIGTPTASVSKEVAEVQRLLKASGLSYSMHSAGTTVEGSWDAVLGLIGQAHTLLHSNGVVRIQTDVRIGTRTDKKQSFQDKVDKVNSILAADTSNRSGQGNGGNASKAMQGIPVDAEGNAGHVAGGLQGKWGQGKDEVEKAVEKEEESGGVKGADVVTAPEVVGPGKVEGTWIGQVKE